MVLFVANIALVATGRSAHLALLVAGGVAAFSLMPGRRRWLVLVLVPLAGGALLASSSMVRERFATAYGEFGTVQTSPVETSMGLRSVIWETTRELIARRPLLGYGVGGFAPAYAELVHQHYTGWQAAEAKDTHNQYLHVMVEAGIPGVLAFLAFVAGVLRQPAPAPFRGAGIALLAAWLATSLFNSHFQTFAEAHLLDLVLGMCLAGGTVQPAASAAPAAAATAS
jgi:O-antigen ligase